MKKWFLATLLACAAAMPAHADVEAPDINENGQVGGLHLPTARTLDSGSAYAGGSYGEPYHQLYAGFQPLEDLRLTIREQQDGRTDETYPGLDAQIQLTDESTWIPETALGYTNFIGQARFGGEYLAFAKRYFDFDFNAGLGWGRYGQNGIFKNPFAQLSSRFRDPARDNGMGSTGWNAFYRGSRMGLFGTVTYQTPWQPLKLLVEFDRDPYVQERAEAGLSRGAPVNIGARYAIWDGLAFTAELDSLSRPQVNLSYTLNLQKDADEKLTYHPIDGLKPAPLPAPPAASTDLNEIQILAARQGTEILSLERRHAEDDTPCEPGENDSDPDNHCTRLYLRTRAGNAQPSAAYLGRAAYHVLENADHNIQSVTVVPEQNGLVAGSYTFTRRNFTQATHFNGSPEEILQSAQTAPAQAEDAPSLTETPAWPWHFFTTQRFDLDPYEFSSFMLTRERLFAGGSYEILTGISMGVTGALEVGDNYPYILPAPYRAVRSNISAYTTQAAKFENLYVNATHTIAPGLHARITAGLLEEMYRGVSSELLYQPYQARWAIGAEENWLQQRSPSQDFGVTGLRTHPAALRFYYEIPPRDLTVIVSAEQYLAQDQGFSVELRQQFLQGVRLSFLGTWSDHRDFGGLEDRGHTDARLVLDFPLQYTVDDLPIENHLNANVGSVARDMGQEVELPVPDLWDATRPVSYGPILRSWDDLLGF